MGMLLGDAPQPWPGGMFGEPPPLGMTGGEEIGDPSGVFIGGMNGVFGIFFISAEPKHIPNVSRYRND